MRANPNCRFLGTLLSALCTIAAFTRSDAFLTTTHSSSLRPMVRIILSHTSTGHCSKYSNSLRRQAKSKNDGELGTGFSSEEPPEISFPIHAVIDQNLGVMMSKAAINTVSYYMLEFHDDLTQQWMMTFQDYREKGFKDDDNWQEYIENLIEKDPIQLTVYMNPKRVSAREKAHPNERNMKIKFHHDIEPRKVAHRIVSVRENVCQELTQDLGSIRGENEDAIRFASNWMQHGKQFACEHRGVTRMTSGVSTPLREKTFKDASLLLTNIALDIVRAELNQHSDKVGLKVLEELLDLVDHEADGLTPLDRIIHQELGPRRLLEELCFVGFSSGVADSDASEGRSKTNFLKLAQRVMDTRLAVALDACKVLTEQCRLTRHYYKLIKDKGGYSLFSKTRTEMKVVNMVNEVKENPAVAAAAAAALGGDYITTSSSNTADSDSSKVATTSAATAGRKGEKVSMDARSQVEREAAAAAVEWSKNKQSNDADNSNSSGGGDGGDNFFGGGTIGPVMM